MILRFEHYLLLSMAVFSMPCFSEPVGGEITSGSGQIQSPSSNTTLVTQETNTLSINWQSLNLSADESLRFEQPTSQSTALNFILDQQPSNILGQIDANGRIFLMNPNGIVFGESARINVGALAAGAFQIDEDILKGSGAFVFNTSQGLVENNGKITTADGGSVALIGQTVSNNGEITAQLGKVHLLSADTASLSFDADGLIQFSISKETLENASAAESAVYNSGVLQADGGYVVLEAHAAKNIYNNVVNNEGLIQANSISNVDGVIRLEGIGGNVINSGDLHATGMGEMQTGGDISLFGDRVGVFGNANIDASGNAGGGNIAIGGYRKGAGDNVSEFTQVTRDTTIRADAITQGDGGEIVIWADNTTWAAGSVSATGGELGGDGGFAEISGKQGLVLSADVNLTANNGSFGTLLLDPTDIVIHDTPQGDDGLLPDLSIATVPGIGVFNIGKPALESLAFGSNLILEATNNITINDLSGDNSLDFIINNTGSITMTADAGVADGLGSFTMNTGDTITTQGGSLTIAGAGVTLGNLSTGAGSITINSTRSVDMGAATSVTQAVNVSVDSDNNGAETLTLRGALSGSSVNLQGGTNGGDTLIAPDSVNTWALTALNAGTLNGNNFSFFPNLTGGSLDDTFTVTGIGSIGPTGKFDGGNHTTGDTVDYSGSPTIVSLVLNGNIFNVENIIGNGAASSLTADNVPNTWVINSENDGAVAGISFVDFSNLAGGTDTDDFTLNGGSVTGIINGGGGVGINSLTANDAANSWNILSADSGNIVGDVALFANIANVTGGSFADTFVLNAGSISGTINGGGGNDTLSADNVANIWSITANNAGDVTGVAAFQNIENLNGRNDTDDFSVGDGFSISGTIDAGSGVDTIDLSSQTAAVIVDLGGTSYINFEEYTGNGSDSTLVAANVANVWSISSGDGVDDGTVGGVAFINFNNLTGGSDTDTFSLSSGTLSGALNGGGGIDTLVGDNTANTWNITVTDAGTATGVGSFSSIENLTGNIDTDDFIFADSSSLTGVINGSLGSDVVNLSAETGTVTVTMGASGFANIETFFGNGSDSTLIGDNVANSWLIDGVNDGTITYPLGSTVFTNFNNLTGGSSSDIFTLSSGSVSGQIDGGGGVNTLVGDNVANTWIITGADSGTVSGVSGFSNIGNLSGNLLADSFIFTNPGSLSGTINGSDGVDTVNYSAKIGAVSVDLSNSSVVSIETFIGNNTNSTLFGDDVANTWSISGVNDGTLGIISFVDFNNLTGNDNNDDFQLLAGGSITGAVTGGLGIDTLTAADSINAWNITGPDIGNLNGVLAFSEIETLQGGTAADTFIFSDGASFGGVIDGDADSDTVNHSAETGAVNINLSSPAFANIESFIGNGSNSTLLGPGVDSTWLVTGLDSGTVNGVAFSGFNNITGNTLDDTFQISGGSISGSLSGGIGTDTLMADDVINTWDILGTDTGDVTNVATFSQIENIVGGSMFDAFVYDNGADITGNVDGGLGDDSVDYSAELGALTISLSLTDFSNIELFIGNNIDSTFIGPVSTNNWVITGNNDGTIGSVTFNNFNNLVGNVTADNFSFQNGSAITGSIDGDTGLDTVDFSSESGVVNVAIGTAGFTRIETFIGNNMSSTLTGDNIANSWVVNDINDGTVGAISFFDFNNLTGNAGIDDFNLNGGSITGTLNGAGGVNSVTADNTSNAWTITSANSGNVTGIAAFTNIENLNGNAGADIYTFSDGSSISGIIDGGGAVDVIDQSAQSGVISLTIGASGYSNIESFIGNGNGTTLTGENVANSWTITGLDSGTVGATNFTNISNLQGGNGDDSFTINGGNVSGTIDGGSGSDLILAGNVANTWNITGPNSGNLTNVNSFSGIETLQGNSSTDNYVFADGSNFSGIVDGAGGLLDLVDYSSETSAVTVSLASSQFLNIESYIGNSSNSTLVGENSSNAWSITGSNSGSVNGINFTGFNNVTGNASVDIFTLAGGNITGIIDGDTGNDTIQADNITNTWNVTSSDTGNLTSVNAFQNIDNLTGGNTIDTFNIDANLSGIVDGAGGDDIINLGGLVVIGGGLVGGSGSDVLSGPTQNSNWNISAADSGSVNSITFSQIETLNGGIGDDTFNVANSASAIITGGISGGAGNDDIFIDYVGASSRTINFDGGAGIDSISLVGAAAGLNNDYIFGPASDMVNITSTTGVNVQNITGTGIEIVTDSMTADGINLTGSNGNDVMQISPGLISGSQPTSFQIAGMPALQFSNKNDLSINAGFGTDSITVNGVVNVAGDINIASELVNQGAGGQLRADTLSFNQATSIGSSLNPLATSVNTLVLNGSTVDAYILEENALSASVNNLSGILSLTTVAGDITSSGNFNITGTSYFNVADGGSIILDDLANQIAGTPTFASAGTLNNLVLMNNRAIDLPNLNLAGDLTIISTGDVTQSGVLSVLGNTSIDANSNSIILNDAANDFVGSVSLQNSGASNTAIFDVNSLELASSNIGTGTLVISAGDINQSGPVIQSANAGTVTVTASSGDIALTNAANEFTGSVSINNTSGGDSALIDSSELRLASSVTNGGDLTVTANNSVNLTGTTTSSGGDITITSNTGDIQLGRLDSDAGRLTINAATGNVLGNNSPITDPNLYSQTLEIIAGATIGDFNNPISIFVPTGGTSFFLAGQGSANIIGITGTVLPGSVRVNNVTNSNIAVGKGQSVSFLEDTLSPTQAFLSPLFDVSGGGIHSYQFETEPGLGRESDRRNERLVK